MQKSTIRITAIRYDHINSWNIDNLIAPFWRLYWNKQATASLVYGKKKMRIEPSYFYLVPAHTLYRGTAEGPVDHCYIHFHLDWPFPERRPIKMPIHQEMRTHLQRLTRLCRIENSDAVKAEKQLVAHAMIYDALTRIEFNQFQTHEEDRKFEEVIGTMLENLQRSISNEDLAKLAGMSLSSFLREFKKRYQITPAKYLTLLRLNVAATLLHHHQDSIEAIAEQTGFYDRYHFTKTFTQHRGIPPAAFRRQMQEASQKPSAV